MHGQRHILKSVGAVLAGVLVGVLLSLGTYSLLRAAGVFPALGERVADPLLVLATVYRTVYGIVSSYITAWLAPNRPMTHVLVLGSLGLAVNVLGTVVTWNKGPAFGPHWYPVALIVLALPTAWAGGKLFLSRIAAAKGV
ncbi:MAG: hypothetical protein KGM96_02040 [Acidobacteriota bacterium]|nr:hypothetical protein [Acidobacteriota bacterium]